MKDRRVPEKLGDALQAYLTDSGLDTRVEAAKVIPDWPALVGPAVAEVTEPLWITADGTLFVAARSHAWMSELQLMEPELLRTLNGGAAPTASSRVKRIRLQLSRPDSR